ncbi:MAG: bifunctional UDP-3-O-[3-hydroxymyristoyl] N-acetylglucosamine deacetylase/3-hydroxyacyl-ACP dehydratase [Microscillaceae bacterium]|jgi:UDP-3-O-[3-hydroxymyristoyl] N-acetylglucosamine deacetylase/3-hydroxyacyl-[acyl-carrier-protein] dehydratase|nr:bifunctional UDP-3-O-[3-hydroxymyristoyl] N-acetylglucosamine deacetylase/3-hydroxyacyl-ACP dehydratase [Microscillaceae bacterium]
MNLKQHTIQKPAKVSGVGLHTGATVNMTFLPAPPHHGFKFQRIDVEGQPIVEADVDNVVDTSRGTTIEKNGARVHTVEHTLAALVGLQIDNVLIQLDGPEPPIMDGSSIEFIKALQEAGVEEQNALRNFYEIKEGIFHRDKAKEIELAALPLNDYRITVMVDYQSSVLGSQYALLNDISEFQSDIAPCRTFCFLHELEVMHQAGLIRGGNLNNAIVMVDKDKPLTEADLERLSKILNHPHIEVKKEGILNNIDLHFPNEPARHKLLDVVGDLALVGRPLKGQIMAARPGHAANVALAKKIKQAIQASEVKNVPHYDPKMPPLMDVNHIAKILPHRYPFALLDKIFYLDSTTVAGVKNVTINEPFFMGHFPGNPVMPGVLQLEAMAQTGGILVLSTVPDPENYWAYLLSIDECRFKKMVIPGDTIVFRCELLYPIRRGIAKMRGEAFVGDTLVCEATLSASIVRKS